MTESGEVFKVLRRHWLFIVVSALLGAALGLGWAATRTPEYSARAEVFITVTSGQTTGELAQGSNFSQQQARNFAALATREIVLAPVIDTLELDATVAELRRSVSATVPLNTSLISLQATHPVPALAADIANAAARELANTVAGVSPKVDDLKGAPVRAQLIENATVPTVPSSPNISLLAIFGLLFGLVLAVVVQIVSGMAVSRIRTPQQLETTLGRPLLGSVNRDRASGAAPISVVSRPLSVHAEQIRHVRTALKYLPADGNRVFVISSAVPGEGKSSTAANVAAAFAADGLSTCLVEADMRRPALTDILDLPNGIGLSDVITGEFDVDEALQEWGPNDLHVLTAGGLPPNPSELLGSDRGREVMARLQSRFDVTIVDTPPVTAVTDASVLGRQFGGVVLVAGAGLARASDLRRAVSALTASDIPVLGAVMNFTKPEGTAAPYAYEAGDGRQGGRRRAARHPVRARTTRHSYRGAGKVAVALALAAALVFAWTALVERAGDGASDSSAADIAVTGTMGGQA